MTSGPATRRSVSSRRSPFSVLKIDKSFVFGIVDEERDRQLVDAMIRMAHALGRIVVAEGVETQEHAELLTASACEIAQGWHFGRPVSGAAIAAELESALLLERKDEKSERNVDGDSGS